ncbi:MAG TPA: ABC transporter ATP-binding protein, partial [Kofleriaceae bacterium]|nr:ABC transporter ATP-binding protein [Kofleriaceae bacterium]
RAHEGLLAEWAVAGRRVLGAVLTVEALSSLGALPVAAWLIYSQLSGATALGGILLLAYWALNLPLIGQEIAAVAREAARQRNVSLRLAELLGAPAATPGEGEANIAESESPGHASARARAPGPGPADRRGIAIELAGVAVRAGGHTVLDGIDLAISAGCHAAIVGPSGSGKSTLLGLLLGWHQPAHGSVLADGEAVAGAHLEALRRSTAWVDPSIHLWNRSLLDNLRQGGAADVERLDEALDGALLRGVLARLPDGLQTRLGEGGTRLSGGEGQRVRLGRAVLRSGVRLAILDEPFGGLDRDQRQLLLRRARARWKQVTILLVTHDVADTLDLDRVIVLDGGRIIEDGGPRELASRSGSRYAQLLAAEDAVRRGLWDRPGWRRLRLEDGAVVERGAAQ